MDDSKEFAEPLGETTTVRSDGYAVTIQQRRDVEGLQSVILEPHELFNLVDFMDDQARLRELRVAHIRQKTQGTVKPEWTYNARYNVWEYRVGDALVELAPRPVYCDRGRWLATVTGIGDLDGADGFPMYFQDLERAKLEMQAWLDHHEDYKYICGACGHVWWRLWPRVVD